MHNELLEELALEIDKIRRVKAGRAVYPKSLKKKVASAIDQGIPARDLTQRTGLSRSSVDKWTRGFRPNSKITVDDLVKVDGDKHQPPLQEPEQKIIVQIVSLKFETTPEALSTHLANALRNLGGIQ